MEYSTTQWNVKLPEEAIVFELHSLYAWLLKMTDDVNSAAFDKPWRSCW
jgi:hypothetical protein